MTFLGVRCERDGRERRRRWLDRRSPRASDRPRGQHDAQDVVDQVIDLRHPHKLTLLFGDAQHLRLGEGMLRVNAERGEHSARRPFPAIARRLGETVAAMLGTLRTRFSMSKPMQSMSVRTMANDRASPQSISIIRILGVR